VLFSRATVSHYEDKIHFEIIVSSTIREVSPPSFFTVLI
jgi:hypothetical protein